MQLNFGGNYILLREYGDAEAVFLFYLFLAVLGLRCCVDFSLVSESKGYSLVAVFRLLLAVASLCRGAWALGHSGFSSCSTWVQQLWLPGSTVHRLSSCGVWA